jgi:hypothetical protein
VAGAAPRATSVSMSMSVSRSGTPRLQRHGPRLASQSRAKARRSAVPTAAPRASRARRPVPVVTTCAARRKSSTAAWVSPVEAGSEPQVVSAGSGLSCVASPVCTTLPGHVLPGGGGPRRERATKKHPSAASTASPEGRSGRASAQRSVDVQDSSSLRCAGLLGMTASSFTWTLQAVSAGAGAGGAPSWLADAPPLRAAPGAIAAYNGKPLAASVVGLYATRGCGPL